MTQADTMRRKAKAFLDGGTWTEEERIKITRRVQRSIARIFERDWLPHIEGAAEKGKRRVEIRLGASADPRASALSHFGLPLLKAKGYRVEAPQNFYGNGYSDLSLVIHW